ncbi:hypothetical protein [Caballeronia ptereochthonis]|uniref:Uncharacterized protein n=1 Tax=Caballeronia ptereochthonis TaxID=1777144 RepID=A0A158D9I9_9BURK|nr:hypothetical protein [Caballeronia ptereochthonis]SAK91315.1 hypothetical protein AWB83_05201 [Caballeronia ptereochthonis]
MSHFLMQYWQVLSGPALRVRERFATRAAQDASARAAAMKEPAEDAATRADQLEHIAVYARAGYFNMGYTVDAFQLPAEAPPH